MKLQHFLLAALLACALPPASAHGDEDHAHDQGHGHGHAETRPDAGSAASVRFSAVSEKFELVGMLDGKRLVLYLDRFADNAPVTGASLDLDIGGVAVRAEPHGDGEFEALLAVAPASGVLPVAATVRIGGESDSLAGELDLHADEHAHDEDAAAARARRRALAWGAGGLLVLGAAAWAWRKRMARGLTPFGGAA